MGGCGHHRFDRFFELIGAADRVLDIASFLTEQRTGDLEAAFGDGPGHRDRIADLTRTIRGFTWARRRDGVTTQRRDPRALPRRCSRDSRRRAGDFSLASVRIGLALGLLLILLSRVEWRGLVNGFANLDWWWIPILLSIRIVALFVQSQRWRLFLADHGIAASNARLFKSYWIARFFNNFLPGQLGGRLSCALRARSERK